VIYMNMKNVLLSLCTFALLLGLFTLPAQAATFLDDFNDGNADGWDLSQTEHPLLNIGNWRVVDGKLVQDTGYDGVLALLPNQYSDQTDETLLKVYGPSGATGFVIWYKDKTNSVSVLVANGLIGVAEVYNNVWTNYSFPVTFNINEDRWADLKVEANSLNGEIKVYLDGTYLFTYNATAPNRVGQTGFKQGNAGGAHDYISIITPDPSPTNKDQCKNDDWKTYGEFKNQGDCISFVVTRGNSSPAGQ